MTVLQLFCESYTSRHDFDCKKNYKIVHEIIEHNILCFSIPWRQNPRKKRQKIPFFKPSSQVPKPETTTKSEFEDVTTKKSEILNFETSTKPDGKNQENLFLIIEEIEDELITTEIPTTR